MRLDYARLRAQLAIAVDVCVIELGGFIPEVIARLLRQVSGAWLRQLYYTILYYTLLYYTISYHTILSILYIVELGGFVP